MLRFPTISLFFLLFASIFGYGQSPVIKMQKSLGGSLKDYEDYSGLVKTADGGYLITTSSKSIDGDMTGNHGYYDILAVKFNSNDQIEWKKVIGGSYDEFGTGTILCTDGGFLFYCASSSNNGDISGNHGDVDYCLIKTDASGNILWQKSYGGSSWDFPTMGIQTTDGGFLIGGNTASNNGDVTGHRGLGLIYDLWLLKVSATGTIEWQKCFGGYNDETYVFQIFENANDYTIAGNTSSTDGDLTGVNAGGYTTWLFNIDKTNRNINWQKVNNMYSLGNIQKMADGTYLQYPSSNGKLYVKKLSSTGNETSSVELLGGLFFSFSINDFLLDSDGGYVFVGTQRIADRTFPELLVVKFDASFNLVWQKSCGGSYYETGYRIIKNGDDFIVLGTSDSNDSDVNGNHGDIDIWLLRLGINTGAIKINNPANPIVSCSKTSGNTPISITFSTENIASDTFVAQLSDINGSFASPLNIGSSSGGTINGQIPPNLTPGNYRVRIKSSTVISYNYSNIIIQNTPPTATVTGINVPAEVYKGENVFFKINFTGNSPWTYTLSSGYTETTSTTPQEVGVTVEEANLIRITNLNNGCGTGTVSSDLSYKFSKYCFAGAYCYSYLSISSFILSKNNVKLLEKVNSGCSPGGLGRFTNLEAPVKAGESYQFEVRSPGQEFRIWIDVNGDSSLADYELVYAKVLPSDSPSFQGTFTIPTTAIHGKTLMRIISGNANYPCSSSIYGEIEDYTLNIENPCQLALTLSSALTGIQTFSAKNSISATNAVESNANVSYDAGKNIELKAGFTAKTGSVFKAFIKGCGND